MKSPISLQQFKCLFIILLISIAGTLKAQQTYFIKGTVRDDNGPLPGATVFLTGTKVITACDNKGVFQLDHISPGQYVLVAKMIGFEPYSTAVIIKNAGSQLSINLKTNTSKLKEVVITADNDWEAHYREFKQQFLGSTPNAADCRIVNPKVLYFHYDRASQTLSASADEFLIIENNALGYRIKYLLDNFEHDNVNNILRYQGYPSFEDMKPKTDKEAARWNANRQKAYDGSIINFMKAVYNDKVYTAGFAVFKLINKKPPGVENDKRVIFDQRTVVFDSLLTATNDGLKTFKFKDAIFILYTKEQESYGYKKSVYKVNKPDGAKIPLGQYSIANMAGDEISIDSHGNFSPSNAIIFEGFMAWEQIADLTPLEFVKED